MKKNIFAKSETEYPYSIVLQPLWSAQKTQLSLICVCIHTCTNKKYELYFNKLRSLILIFIMRT